jgi:hypothetical protein
MKRVPELYMELVGAVAPRDARCRIDHRNEDRVVLNLLRNREAVYSWVAVAGRAEIHRKIFPKGVRKAGIPPSYFPE